MQSPTPDPTAGERARRQQLAPAIAERVTDPTDPRYGAFPGSPPAGDAGEVRPVVDPTDPEWGHRAH